MAKKQTGFDPAALGLVLPAEFWEHVDRGELELQHSLQFIAAGESCGLECQHVRAEAARLSAAFAEFKRVFRRPSGS